MVVKVHCGTVLGDAFAAMLKMSPPKQSHNALWNHHDPDSEQPQSVNNKKKWPIHVTHLDLESIKAFDVEYLSAWCYVYLVSDGVYFFLKNTLFTKDFFRFQRNFLIPKNRPCEFLVKSN